MAKFKNDDKIVYLSQFCESEVSNTYNTLSTALNTL